MCGIFAAVIAVFSQIAIPMPIGVPITLQAFAVSLCGYTLGSKRGAVSAAVYILIGAVGAPVFSSMQGGFGVLFGPAGGFIFGFIPLAALCGIKCGRKYAPLVFGMAGNACCHIIGILWFALVSKTDAVTAFLTISLPYLAKDCALAAAAFALSLTLKKRILRL